jgi:hypothetical protein
VEEKMSNQERFKFLEAKVKRTEEIKSEKDLEFRMD